MNRVLKSLVVCTGCWQLYLLRHLPFVWETVACFTALRTADDLRVCSGSRDTSVRLWDVETSVMIGKGAIPRNVVTDVLWLPGSSVLAQVTPWLYVRACAVADDVVD